MRCIRRYLNLQRAEGNMVGSLAAALGPTALRFRLPMRVVGCGGGSYLGLSFCVMIWLARLMYSPRYVVPLHLSYLFHRRTGHRQEGSTGRYPSSIGENEMKRKKGGR